MQYFESAACWSPGRAQRGSSSPKTTRCSRSAARSPSCGSSPLTMTDASRIERAHSCAPALGDELELPVAVELVAEEVEEADGARPEAAGDLGQRGLVHLEEPELGAVGLEQRGGDARDEVRARRGCAPGASSRPRISATIAAVVVLPFVAEMSTEPRGSRPARRSIASGSSFHRSLPGMVVPPPVRASRDSPPTARAARISAFSGSRMAPRAYPVRARPRPRASRDARGRTGPRTGPGRPAASAPRSSAVGLKRFCLTMRPSFRTSSVPSSIERRRRVTPV